jgi:hypothetical protein
MPSAFLEKFLLPALAGALVLLLLGATGLSWKQRILLALGVTFFALAAADYLVKQHEPKTQLATEPKTTPGRAITEEVAGEPSVPVPVSGRPTPIRSDMASYQVPVLRNLIRQMGKSEMWLSQIFLRGPTAFDGLPAGRGIIDYPEAIRVMASGGEVEILETAHREYTDFYGEILTQDIRFRMKQLTRSR